MRTIIISSVLGKFFCVEVPQPFAQILGLSPTTSISAPENSAATLSKHVVREDMKIFSNNLSIVTKFHQRVVSRTPKTTHSWVDAQCENIHRQYHLVYRKVVFGVFKSLLVQGRSMTHRSQHMLHEHLWACLSQILSRRILCAALVGAKPVKRGFPR